MAESLGGRAHLNLVEASRQLFEFDSGAELEAKAGWLFGAGTPDNPVISNAAFRTDDGVKGADIVARARDFFTERGRGFSLWVRGEEPEDADLVAAASAAGLQQVYAMPEMVLERRPEIPPLAPGVELRRLDSGEDAPTYWRIAATSYADIGFPPEVFEHYDGREGLLADNVAAFIAELDGEPVGIAMTDRQWRRRRHLLGRQSQAGARPGNRPRGDRGRHRRRIRPRRRPRLPPGLADGQVDL